MSNIFEEHFSITREMRNKRNKHSSFVFWFTGLSGSGKSTIANKLEETLYENHFQTYTLDGDNIRGGINKGLSFTPQDRQENLRRIGEIAKIFVDAGVVTIASFVSPLEVDRKLVRDIVGKEDFIEIFVDTSLEECERRDVKGLYKKARAGEIKNFTGIDSPYENPLNPDIIIKTEFETEAEAVQKIISFVKDKLELKIRN
jgi:adenylylsulfate kinase